MNDFRNTYNTYSSSVINELESALSAIDPKQTELFIKEILQARKVFFVGVGRVLLSLQSVCKRFAHLGIDAHYVGEITEPAIGSEDLLIVGSGSGESIFPLEIAKKAYKFGATIVHIGSSPNSSMRNYAKLMVRIPTPTKLSLPGEISSSQPMTSLFEQTLLVYGDILAKCIINEKNLDMPSLWQYHANLE